MVGTSIPKIKQAIPVKIKAIQILLSEKEIIREVNLIPRPVIERTPIIIDAHIIIEPIRDICFPANTNDLYNLLNPNSKLNLILILKNNKQAANKIEIAAEY